MKYDHVSQYIDWEPMAKSLGREPNSWAKAPGTSPAPQDGRLDCLLRRRTLEISNHLLPVTLSTSPTTPIVSVTQEAKGLLRHLDPGLHHHYQVTRSSQHAAILRASCLSPTPWEGLAKELKTEDDKFSKLHGTSRVKIIERGGKKIRAPWAPFTCARADCMVC